MGTNYNAEGEAQNYYIIVHDEEGGWTETWYEMNDKISFKKVMDSLFFKITHDKILGTNAGKRYKFVSR